MNQWAFVAAAYLVTLGGTGALAGVSWWAMRRAERLAASDDDRR